MARTAALLAFAASVSLAMPVSAQGSNLCAGRLGVTSVQSSEYTGSLMPPGTRQYSYTLRNQSSTNLRFDVTFSGFPANWAQAYPSEINRIIRRGETRTYDLGLTADPAFSQFVVAYVQDDGAVAGRPTVRLYNCRPA